VVKLVVPARSVLQATPRSRLLTLDLRDQPFSFTAGQAVFAGLADGSIRRPYSIACSPSHAAAAQALELLVQIDDAPENPHLECVAPGTPVHVEGPFGSFCLPAPVSERHVLFIAGGTGIAPLRSMLWEILDRQPDLRAGLIYSARSPEEFAFLGELNDLVAENLLDLRLTVTREHEGPWSGKRGRIDSRVIAESLKSIDTRCFICGPPALVNDSVAWLRAAGVPDERIQSEAE
jgi:ferredoxin-NADP reductase